MPASLEKAARTHPGHDDGTEDSTGNRFSGEGIGKNKGKSGPNSPGMKEEDNESRASVEEDHTRNEPGSDRPDSL